MAKHSGSIMSTLENIISNFEKERFSYFTAFLWALLLGSIRTMVEANLLDYPYKELSYAWLFNQAHIIGFFLSVFIGGVLIIKLITNQKLLKIINLACIGFTLALIPPFLDLFFNIGSISYTYVNPLDFITSFSKYFVTQGGTGGLGVLIELFAIMIATSSYVYIITKSVKKFLLNFFIFFIFIMFMGTPLSFFLIGEYAGNLIQPIAVIRYTLLAILFLLLLFKVEKKGLLKSFVKSMRLTTTAHFVLMTIVGVFIAGNLGQVGNIQMDLSNFLDPTFWAIFTGNIGTFILTLLSIIFCWQYAVMINHVYDVKIDILDNRDRILPKKMMSVTAVKSIALIFAGVCLGLSFIVSLNSFLLMVAGIFFGTIYSVPPIRLRDGVFSTSIIGVGSSIAFFLGFVTPAYIKVMHGEMAGEVMRIYPEFTTDALIIGLLIFVALTIGPLIKDYKDYEGDKKAGVKNLFTIYGLEKGVTITSALLPVPFLCLLLLFNNLIDIVIILPLGIVSGALFKIFRKTAFVFAIYFPIIIYCLLRWFEIIQL